MCNEVVYSQNYAKNTSTRGKLLRVRSLNASAETSSSYLTTLLVNWKRGAPDIKLHLKHSDPHRQKSELQKSRMMFLTFKGQTLHFSDRFGTAQTFSIFTFLFRESVRHCPLFINLVCSIYLFFTSNWKTSWLLTNLIISFFNCRNETLLQQFFPVSKQEPNRLLLKCLE